jgi:ATP synthase protein I
VSPLLGALASGAVAVLVLVVVAALTDGRPAVVGAATGGVVTLAVFALGITVVGLVARVMPSASLLVALMTYALQLLVLALVVAALERAEVGADTLSRGWFAAGVIAVTLLWLVGQLVAATRERRPAYDTPETPSSQDGLAPHPGGER